MRALFTTAMSGFLATLRNLTDMHISGRSLSSLVGNVSTFGVAVLNGQSPPTSENDGVAQVLPVQEGQRPANAIRSYRLRSDFAERWSVAGANALDNATEAKQ